ncbi:NAD(P)H-dependent oxidoreductase [Microlunatus ginsengisoli]|uniref:FMN dependent NADH:quinone oxidoreductase n=2 Tax=Microlunatus ginsengisoli TaxID=363863 RepID=A0ABP6ZL36_9ACTN
MTVLRIDASIQGDRSASSALADLALAEFEAIRPDEPKVSRHLGADPLPSEAWAAATAARFVEPEARSAAQSSALELAQTVARELAEADAAILALPLYNWGVSQHVKTWIDLAVAGAAPGTRLLDGTPVLLLTSRGGAYGPGTGREGWDHNTGYLRHVLAGVWGADLSVVEREMTLVGVNPALDKFTDAAAVVRREAEEAARAAGRALAVRTERHLAA